MTLKNPGYEIRIDAIAELESSCPACGADARAFEIVCGAMSPIVGVCMDCAHTWAIHRESHAGKFYFKHRKLVSEL